MRSSLECGVLACSFTTPNAPIARRVSHRDSTFIIFDGPTLGDASKTEGQSSNDEDPTSIRG